MSRSLPLDVVVTRGAIAEARHRVHAAVVDAQGRLLAAARDADLRTMWRSCAKPFQAMPLLESGGVQTLGWTDDALALACASHGGEPEHVRLAARMLASLELAEADLACGPQVPLSARGAAALRARAAPATRLHNNCSGKHAAMLARARLGGWDTAGYHRATHPVQTEVLEVVSRWTDIAPEQVERGVDGCGVVVFGLPLRHMALAYARLAAASARGEVPARRITDAIAAHPHRFGGSDSFDTAAVGATAGRVITKTGAEGVHSAALLDSGLGVTIKVEDGATRAQYPAMLRVLQLLGALPRALPPSLAAFARCPVRNTRDEEVGIVAVEADVA